MKNTITTILLATMTLPSFAIEGKLEVPKLNINQLSGNPKLVKAMEQNPNLKKIIESKVLEQNYLNGITKFRLGTNSGGGGDETGLDFLSTLQTAIEGLSNQSPAIFSSIKENLAEVMKQIKVIVVDEELEAQIKGYTQNSVAVNLPQVKTILVNRQRWINVRDGKIKEGIALHEVLSLLKLESTGSYSISSKYVTARGAGEKELTSVMQVNRMQQIRSLDKTMSDGEILRRFFEEAFEPITLDEFPIQEDIFEAKSKVICAESSDDYINVHKAGVFGRVYARVQDRVNGKPGKPGHGPLFPPTPDEPGIPEKYEFRLHKINENLTFDEATKNPFFVSVPVSPVWNNSKMTISSGEISELIRPYDGKTIGLEVEGRGATAVRYTLRKNNGMITYLVEYYLNSAVIDPAQPEYEKLINTSYGYCYLK